MNGLIVDLFAGGGGASLGIKLALGRDPDIAINHDPEAVAMHQANHPGTIHYAQDVWRVPPLFATEGRPIDLLWASPDCTHFSKAKGGKPRKKHIRDLAWVVVEWARKARPRVIILENVEEFRNWGPLGEDRLPIKGLAGQTFDKWVRSIRRAGYHVDWRELRACDYGAPTIRKRLFLIARRDDQPITWPEPTHGPDLALPWRTAAECIDWSLPCPSIFERARPLAENTLKRIAAGIKRYVIDSPDPFIIPMTHHGDARTYGLGEPMRTVTAAHRGEFGLVTPFLTEFAHSKKARNWSPVEPLRTQCAGTKCGHFALVAPTLMTNTTGHAPRPLVQPLPTLTTGGHQALVAAFMAKHYGGVVGHGLRQPVGTVTARDHHSLVTSNLVKLRGTCRDGQPVTAPVATITGGGKHLAEVRAFLLKYHGTGRARDLRDPAGTVTTKHRLGLVTVNVGGEPYVISDIGLRMLQPRELFRAQGFPDSYVIDLADRGDGKPLTKTSKVRLVGNSVCPPVVEALVRANFAGEIEEREAA